LKAKAYDLITTLETAKQMLMQVNQQIIVIQNKPKEKPKVKEEKK